jgi:hypothetical protein
MPLLSSKREKKEKEKLRASELDPGLAPLPAVSIPGTLARFSWLKRD